MEPWGELEVLQATGCPNGCDWGQEEHWTQIHVYDNGESWYQAQCPDCGADWDAINDSEITANILAATLAEVNGIYAPDTVTTRINAAHVLAHAPEGTSVEDAKEWLGAHREKLRALMKAMREVALKSTLQEHPLLTEDLPDNTDWQ